MLISQSALCTFASAFTLVTLALCVKCRRSLKGTLHCHFESNLEAKLSLKCLNKIGVQKLFTIYHQTWVIYAHCNLPIFHVNRIVTHNNIQPADYYTISRKGVTRMRNNEAEFTELDRWEQEYKFYTRLVKIPTFAMFRKWKAFTTWRKNVCSKKITSCKKQLEENLFIVNPVSFKG